MVISSLLFIWVLPIEFGLNVSIMLLTSARRNPAVEFDPYFFHTTLIYNPTKPPNSLHAPQAGVNSSTFFLFFLQVAVGTQNNRLCDLVLNGLYPITLVDHLAYIGFFGSTNMMKSQNHKISFSAFLAWMLG